MTKPVLLGLRLSAVLFLLIAVAILAVPPIILHRLEQNERNASSSLKTLTSAEADFRANDRDWNHVNDFWTGDVAGLYYLRSTAPGSNPEIQLIDRSIAEADVHPLKPLAPIPVPKNGYYYVALEADDTLKDSESHDYKQDTGGTSPMGKVHNTSKFGFCAFPAKYGVTGRYTFLVNENNTVFRGDTAGVPPTSFPDLAEPWPPGSGPPAVDLWGTSRSLSWFAAGGLAILGVLILLAAKPPLQTAEKL